MNNQQIKTAAGFLLGTICGTVIGILTAPAKGKETRSQIHRQLKEISNELNSLMEESIDRKTEIVTGEARQITKGQPQKHTSD